MSSQQGTQNNSVAGLLEHFLTAEDLRYLDQASFPTAQRIRALRTGAHKARLRGGTTEFADHRPYSPGDEVRRLDWRIVGRSDRLEVKLYDDPSTLDNLLLLDASGSMKFGDSTRSKFAYASSVTAFLAKLLIGQRDPVGLSIAIERNPVFLPAKSTTPHLTQMLGILRGFEPGGKTALAGHIRHLAKSLRNPTRVIVVSDCFVDLKLFEGELRMLVGRGHRFHVLHTVAPEEVNFAYRQPVRFTSLEDNHWIDANPQEILDGYMAAMRSHVDALRRICMHYGAGYEPLLAAPHVGRALTDFLRRQGKR